MDIAQLTQLINGVGFPIVAAGAMFWYIVNDRKLRTEERKEWLKTIDRNTDVIEALIESIEKEEKQDG